MLLMVAKGISRRICHSIYRYAKLNNKYIKNFNKNEDSSCVQYCDVTIYMDGQLHESF